MEHLSNMKRLRVLFNPNVLWFYLKQAIFALRYKKNISIKHFSLMIETGAVFSCHEDGRIKLGRKFCIRKGADIEVYKGATIEIGDNVFINKNSSIVSRYGIKIGDNCMIGEMVNIYDHDHAFHKYETPFYQQGFIGAPVTIGNNVWIGSGAFIRRGVEIGDNVVIGAATMVTENIPSNTVAYSRNELLMKPLPSQGC